MQQPGGDDIIDKAGFEALLGRSGVAPATTVVVYSGLSNLLTTFAFWLFKVYGHQDVRLLDGGRVGWLVQGRPLSTETPTCESVIYRAQPPQRRLRARRADVLHSIGRPAICW